MYFECMLVLCIFTILKVYLREDHEGGREYKGDKNRYYIMNDRIIEFRAFNSIILFFSLTYYLRQAIL